MYGLNDKFWTYDLNHTKKSAGGSSRECILREEIIFSFKEGRGRRVSNVWERTLQFGITFGNER